MNLPVRRTPARYMLYLQEVLQDGGISMSQVAQASGLSEEFLFSPTSGMTDADLERFVMATRNLTGRGDLGLELGRRIKGNSHGPVGFALISATTLHDFFCVAVRNFHLLNPAWDATYRRSYAGGELIYTPRTAPNRDTLHFTTEAMALSVHTTAALMMGDRMPTYDIHMPIAKPEHGYNYTEFERVRFHFHENVLPSIRFVMPAAMLDLPLTLGNPDVVREVEARLGVSSMPVYSEVCWSDYVGMLLRQAPGTQVTLEALGRHIQVSGRTIHRHLKKEGLSYQELADKVRFERACQMLETGGITVIDLAERMGFSEVANFSRSFKRVVGVSPGEYRQK